jgi:hypothetical protein
MDNNVPNCEMCKKNNNYLVKDDQIIIINCIANNFNDFELIQENNIKYDNWFLFQRYLL